MRNAQVKAEAGVEAKSPPDHEIISRIACDDGECSQDSDDGHEPLQILWERSQSSAHIAKNPQGETYLNVLARYVDVHSPETGHKVHGNEHGTQSREFGEYVIDLVVCVRHFDRNLGQVVGVRARKDLLVVVQILCHRN